MTAAPLPTHAGGVANEMPKALVFNAYLEPADVHVHEAGVTLGGDPCLWIDGHLYVVRSLEC